MSAVQQQNLAYQELVPDDILSSVERLGYRCDGRLLALNSYENRVYRVGIEDAPPVVVKFYRPGRWSDAAIIEEHEFTTALAAQEIPVVAPIAHGGETLAHFGAFRYAVYPSRGGRMPDLDDLDLLEQLGRFIARIHLLGEQEAFKHRPAITLERFGIESHDYLLESGVIPPEIAPAYKSICAQLFESITACFERAGDTQHLRLHGDCHPGNILALDGVLHIVDFDDTQMGPAVQDIWMFLSGDRTEQLPQLDALLAGYTEFRKFDARALNLIEALRTLRIMHYAAWLARRYDDPAFQQAFPWFDSRRYWDEHVLALREQTALMQEPPLQWRPD